MLPHIFLIRENPPLDYNVLLWFALHMDYLLQITIGPDSIWIIHLTSIGNPIVEIRRSYLLNGIPYTGKMASLYWIRLLFSTNNGSDVEVTSQIAQILKQIGVSVSSDHKLPLRF